MPKGRWKALQASGIYERRAYVTEVYRNSLALQVRSLGYEIENRRDSKGRDCGFEIRGVSQQLLDKFSQRSRQRDAAIQVFVADNGRQPTDNEVAVLVRETRADKLTEISTEEVRSRQRDRLARDEIAAAGEPSVFALRCGCGTRRRLAAIRQGSHLRAAVGCARSRGSDGSPPAWTWKDPPFGVEGHARSGGVVWPRASRRPGDSNRRESAARTRHDRPRQPWHRQMCTARRRREIHCVRSAAAGTEACRRIRARFT